MYAQICILGAEMLHRKWVVAADNVEYTINTGYVGYFIVKAVDAGWATLFRKSYGTIFKVEGTDLDSSHISVTATDNQKGIKVKANNNNSNLIIVEVG